MSLGPPVRCTELDCVQVGGRLGKRLCLQQQQELCSVEWPSTFWGEVNVDARLSTATSSRRTIYDNCGWLPR
jgi:hypothetical protein